MILIELVLAAVSVGTSIVPLTCGGKTASSIH
jgi:hypothetical protein